MNDLKVQPKRRPDHDQRQDERSLDQEVLVRRTVWEVLLGIPKQESRDKGLERIIYDAPKVTLGERKKVAVRRKK